MKKPNILIFVSDQQHAETIGERGLCHTPRLDRLIKEGVHFKQAYTPTPMCTPARGSLMTGLYPHQHKLVYNTHGTDAEPYTIEGIETVGSALAAEGYRTVYAGKWHVGKTAPTANGFQEELQLEPASGRKGSRSDQVVFKDAEGSDQVLAATAGYGPEDTYVFRLARSVNRWLSTASAEDPFLLVASCNEPHVPWVVPEPYASMYNPEDIAEWDSYRDGFEGKPLTYTKHYTNVNFFRLQHDWPAMAKALAHYYGAVTMVDDAFGTILDTLEARGLAENTVIFFMSDHGELLGRHALVGKNELALDDIIRIPFVVYGKGRFTPGSTDRFVSICDVFNTVMELAGAETRDHLDSRSLVPYLEGRSPEGPEREDVVVQHSGTTFPNTIRAVRTKRHKYVFRAHELDEFYDLESDPSERVNRIGDPQCQEIIGTLRARLLEWAEETKDPARGSLKTFFRNPTLHA